MSPVQDPARSALNVIALVGIVTWRDAPPSSYRRALHAMTCALTRRRQVGSREACARPLRARRRCNAGRIARLWPAASSVTPLPFSGARRSMRAR